MTKVGIVMTVRDCLGLSQHAVETFKTKHPSQIYVVDDRSRQDMKDWLAVRTDIVSIIDPPNSTGLAFNWNVGVKRAIDDGCTHILISNNDVLLHPEMIDNLVERMNRGDAVMVTGVNVAGACGRPEDILILEVGPDQESEHPDFSCFMITPKTIELIGWFDENYIGAYVEDCDYHARIVIAGEKAIAYNRAPYYHYASRTIAENPHIAPTIHQNHARNEGYFAGKWGHPHVSDTADMHQVYWKTPFNDPNKTVRDW